MTTLATIKETESRPARSHTTGFDVVRILLALILLVTAVLKAHQLATEPVANKDIFSYRWSLILQVEFEILLGLWLLSGLHKRLVWVIATACFSFFSCITLYKALSGEASCGCFGKIEVNPWYTLILDVSAVVALLIFRPGLRKPQLVKYYWPRFATVIVIVLTAGISAGMAMTSYTPAALTAEGNIIGDSEFVVLEPERWIGKRFPLLEYIDIGDQLADGDWVVLLYHYDCSDCREAVPKYEQFSRDFARQVGQPRIALVEIPPYAELSNRLPSPDSPCTLGRLSNVKEWFVKTPAVVFLSDARVEYATEKAMVVSEDLSATVVRSLSQGAPKVEQLSKINLTNQRSSGRFNRAFGGLQMATKARDESGFAGWLRRLLQPQLGWPFLLQQSYWETGKILSVVSLEITGYYKSVPKFSRNSAYRRILSGVNIKGGCRAKNNDDASRGVDLSKAGNRGTMSFDGPSRSAYMRVSKRCEKMASSEASNCSFGKWPTEDYLYLERFISSRTVYHI